MDRICYKDSSSITGDAEYHIGLTLVWSTCTSGYLLTKANGNIYMRHILYNGLTLPWGTMLHVLKALFSHHRSGVPPEQKQYLPSELQGYSRRIPVRTSWKRVMVWAVIWAIRVQIAYGQIRMYLRVRSCLSVVEQSVWLFVVSSYYVGCLPFARNTSQLPFTRRGKRSVNCAFYNKRKLNALYIISCLSAITKHGEKYGPQFQAQKQTKLRQLLAGGYFLPVFYSDYLDSHRSGFWFHRRWLESLALARQEDVNLR